MNKDWSAEASADLQNTSNVGEIRQKIIDWVDKDGKGWAIKATKQKSFPDKVGSVMVTATKTAATRVSIDRVERGY